ncbi:MAG: outer membrane lipoprotein-sorting protein, partial [Calditrichaeota bacterium]|nr:outer membrane lipoprotein-sorting protein [Calditrichota bacterium]
ECWKIELQPHPDAPVVWGRLLYWVRVGDNLPARIDYFDEKGERIRHLLYSDHKVIGNRKISTRWVMHNDIKEGRQTEIRLLEMQFDVKISDRVFSFRELERGD